MLLQELVIPTVAPGAEKNYWPLMDADKRRWKSKELFLENPT